MTQQCIHINAATLIRMCGEYNSPPWDPGEWSMIEADLNEMGEDATAGDDAAGSALTDRQNGYDVWVAHDADGSYYASTRLA